MKLVVYGNLETCNKCKFVHSKLEKNNVQFDFIDDEKTVLEVAEKLGFNGIPFAIKDNIPMNSIDLMKYVSKM